MTAQPAIPSATAPSSHQAPNRVLAASPAPVVAKVAASTPAVRPDNAAWLQRELDVVRFGPPVVTIRPLALVSRQGER